MTNQARWLAAHTAAIAEHMRDHPGYYIGRCVPEEIASYLLENIQAREFSTDTVGMRAACAAVGIQCRKPAVVAFLAA